MFSAQLTTLYCTDRMAGLNQNVPVNTTEYVAPLHML